MSKVKVLWSQKTYNILIGLYSNILKPSRRIKKGRSLEYIFYNQGALTDLSDAYDHILHNEEHCSLRTKRLKLIMLDIERNRGISVKVHGIDLDDSDHDFLKGK